MELTRSSLLERVRDVDDHESWQEFFAVYEPVMRSVAACYGLPPGDIDDLVQEMFLHLRRELPKFHYDRFRGRFRAWLKTTTEHAIVDWLRKRRRQRRVGPRERRPTPEQPGDVWDRAYRERVLQFALAQLKSTSDPKTLACFVEHLQNGRPAADVARALDLTADAVYQNASRVLKRLRTKCEEFDEELRGA